LIARIKASRGEMAAAAAHLRASLDVRARVRNSLRAHPGAWLGASMVAGLLAAGRLFRRRRPADDSAHATRPRHRARSGLAALILAGAGSLAKSVTRDWLLRESRKRLQGISRF
jgi:hypothetical protein